MLTLKNLSKNSNICLLIFASLFVLLAFSANSLLVRSALSVDFLQDTHVLADAGFVLIRMLTGTITLLFLCALRCRTGLPKTQCFNMSNLLTWFSWMQGWLLFLYMAAFSWAYYELDAGVGALVLFIAAQFTMMKVAWRNGEKFSWFFAILCVLALIGFLSPTDAQFHHRSVLAIFTMLMAGVAWGGFSILGRGQAYPILMITQAFICGSFFAVIWWLLRLYWAGMSYSLPPFGLAWLGLDQVSLRLAILSGTLASGFGYAFWYWLRNELPLTIAAAIQLLVPVMTALLGWLWLAESMTSKQWMFGTSLLLAVLGLSYSVKIQKNQRA